MCCANKGVGINMSARLSMGALTVKACGWRGGDLSAQIIELNDALNETLTV